MPARIAELRARLDAKLEAFENDRRPIVRNDIRQVVRPEALPCWVSARQEKQLESAGPWDVSRESSRVGSCLCVVAEGSRAAWLPELHVERARALDTLATTMPQCLAPDAQEAVGRGASIAIALAGLPQMSARRDLRFSLLAMDGTSLPAHHISGDSLGAAALAATWSLLCGAPLPQRAVVSAALPADDYRPESELRRVGRPGIKAEEVRALEGTLWLQSDDAASLQPEPAAHAAAARNLDQLLCGLFGEGWREKARHQRVPYDFRRAFSALEDDHRTNPVWSRAPELAWRFLVLSEGERLPSVYRALCIGYAGSCYSYAIATQRANTLFDRALAILDEMSPSEEPKARAIVLMRAAQARRDAFRMEEAVELARRSAELTEQGFTNFDDRVERINALSTLGQVLAAAGRPDEGLPLVEKARDHYCDNLDAECPRNHTYVTEVLGRLARLEEAEREYALGVAHNQDRADRARAPLNRKFLDHAIAQARLRALRQRGTAGAWRSLETFAREAVERPPHDVWVQRPLRRIAKTAHLHTLPRPAYPAAIDRIVTDLEALAETRALSPMDRWHEALIATEAAAILARHDDDGTVQQARQLALHTLQFAPSEDAEIRLRPHRERIDAAADLTSLQTALFTLLTAE